MIEMVQYYFKCFKISKLLELTTLITTPFFNFSSLNEKLHYPPFTILEFPAATMAEFTSKRLLD